MLNLINYFWSFIEIYLASKFFGLFICQIISINKPIKAMTQVVLGSFGDVMVVLNRTLSYNGHSNVLYHSFCLTNIILITNPQDKFYKKSTYFNSLKKPYCVCVLGKSFAKAFLVLLSFFLHSILARVNKIYMVLFFYFLQLYLT